VTQGWIAACDCSVFVNVCISVCDISGSLGSLGRMDRIFLLKITYL